VSVLPDSARVRTGEPAASALSRHHLDPYRNDTPTDRTRTTRTTRLARFDLSLAASSESTDSISRTDKTGQKVVETVPGPYKADGRG
jgi:hypothetical protein